jgi:hypothetical protein
LYLPIDTVSFDPFALCVLALKFIPKEALLMPFVPIIKATDIISRTIKEAIDTFSEIFSLLVKVHDEPTALDPFIGSALVIRYARM